MKTIRFAPYIAMLAGIAWTGIAFGQQELILHQETDIWQSNALNPALFPKEKRFVIGLPSFGLDASHSGDITYNDLLRRQGDRTILDLGKAIDKLEPENDGHYDQRFETFSLGLRLPGNWFLQAGHAVRINAALRYPKALAELIWNGNAPYIGQNLNVGFSTTTFDWNELSIGLSRRFGTSLSIGARAKFLSGISSLQTDDQRRAIQVYTDPDIYQLTLQTDYAFHSSSIVSAIDTSGLGFDLALNELKNGFSANTGWAFDLGVQLQAGERLTLRASVLDLGGSISWKKNSNYFYSNGSFTYDGVVIPGTDIINGTTDSLDFTAALDTLNDALDFQKTPEAFTSALPTRYYVGGNFKLNDRWSVGAVLMHQSSEARSATSFGINARWAVLNWLSLGTMYSVNDHSVTNVGLSIYAHPGPVQVFILSDNALNAITPYGSAAVNFRFGGAIVF
ncbi:MAG: hypothetical protein EP344_19815 [Bacteroidetes bacterium]|nr:MAG: hypothetical protein EP344_19815 [Bacteroidota bacterium]